VPKNGQERLKRVLSVGRRPHAPIRLRQLTERYSQQRQAVRELRCEYRLFRRDNSELLKRNKNLSKAVDKKLLKLDVLREELIRFAHPEVKVPLVPRDFCESDSD
jgi:uncharacterized protein (DUF342 family)